MFAPTYFPERYFAPRYFPSGGEEPVPAPATTGASGGRARPWSRVPRVEDDRPTTWSRTAGAVPVCDFVVEAVTLFLPATKGPPTRRQRDEDALLLAGGL